MSRLLINPVALDYKFQHPLSGQYCYREAADPTLVLFKGTYYLFVSKCGGFYYSDDLERWAFHADKNLPIHSYAPDAVVHEGKMYFCASNMLHKSKIYVTEDPLKGFKPIAAPFAFWDPHLFFDDDGRCYLFWGCSCKRPIYGIEMDPRTLKPIGKKAGLIYGDGTKHGIDDKDIYKGEKRSLWDRYISLFTGSGTYIEGVFVNKLNGKYYLQYATPGTEYPTYGDGVFVSDHPLGPYSFQAHNPYSIEAGGCFVGAGHGSTCFDKDGNLWHVSTIAIRVNANFERRIGLWPAFLDEDGILHCDQYLGDYPHLYPDGKFDINEAKVPYVLLSYRKKAMASSETKEWPASNLTDESSRTFWQACSNKDGEYAIVDLGKEYSVSCIQVNLGEYRIPKKKMPRSSMGGTISQERYIEEARITADYELSVSIDGENYVPYGESGQTDLPHRLFIQEAQVRYVKVTFRSFPYGASPTLSNIRVFGLDKGNKPGETLIKEAWRLSATKAYFHWEQDKAYAHVIRIGIAPNKLYSSYTVYGDNEATLTFLNAEGKRYFYAIDAINESGITPGPVQQLEDK